MSYSLIFVIPVAKWKLKPKIVTDNMWILSKSLTYTESPSGRSPTCRVTDKALIVSVLWKPFTLRTQKYQREESPGTLLEDVECNCRVANINCQLDRIQSPLSDISGNTCKDSLDQASLLTCLWRILLVRLFKIGRCSLNVGGTFSGKICYLLACLWVLFMSSSTPSTPLHWCCHQSPLTTELSFFGFQMWIREEWLSRNPSVFSTDWGSQLHGLNYQVLSLSRVKTAIVGLPRPCCVSQSTTPPPSNILVLFV